MKRIPIYLLLTVLALSSCCKEKGDGIVAGSRIRFSPRAASFTKGFMNNIDLNAEGNKLKVYDELTDFTGSVSWMTNGNTYYIDDEILYDEDGDNGAPVWEYTSSRYYPWTTNGSHHFFGWLNYDADQGLSAEDFFGNGFGFTGSGNSKTLSIPSLTMNADTDQFDFMYSDVTTVDAAYHVAGRSVNLNLNHLFTALNLQVLNASDNTIYLKRVTLTGIKNTRSASIAFNALHPEVTTSDLSSSDIVLFESDNIDGDPAGTCFLHSDTVAPLTDFILMWPHTYAELSGSRLVVEYNILDSHDHLSSDLTANVILSNQPIFKTNYEGMDAGTKYSFALHFKESSLELNISIVPWEFEEYMWDYGKHSISARNVQGIYQGGVLVFYRGEGESATRPTQEEWSSKTMKFHNRSEVITGRFYIESPHSGRWMITPTPTSAAQYFIIEPTSGDIDVLTDNGKCEFTVRVNPDRTPPSTQTLYFGVSLFFNGEWYDANSEFNRKNLKLVLDAN